MRAVICLVVLLLCGALSSDPAVESDVLELNSETFDGVIDANPFIAVEFFAPWCGHCKSLAPEWEKVATELKGKVPIAKVDCVANQELCQEYGVKGYPTLKIFRSGKPFPMEVARKAPAIITYLTRELEPAVSVISSVSEVDSVVEKHPIASIAFLHNDHDDRWTAYHAVAEQQRHSLPFYAVIAKSDKETAPPATIVLRRNFDEPKVVYDGEFVSTSIASWITRSLLPILGELNPDTITKYVNSGLPIGHLFVNPEDESTKTLLEELRPALVPYKNLFVVGWVNHNQFAQQAQKLGLSGKVPSILLDNHAEGIRYIFPDDQPMTVASLGEWFTKFKEGALTPFVKSEPIPESNAGPVKVVVAHTFKDIVYDNTKDVLVEFYAPWCGHCKNLAPIYEELGSLYSSIPSVVVAKIDATANDVPKKHNIRGFPTLIYFPANNKEAPVNYQGARTLNDLSTFIHKHASLPFDLPSPPSEHQEHDEL